MEKAKLIIKYKGKYIVDRLRNELNFITVPLYNGNSDYHNIDIFLVLLCFGYMDDNFAATRNFTYGDGLEAFEYFDVDSIRELDNNTFLYDLDRQFEWDQECQSKMDLTKLPGTLQHLSYEEICAIATNNSYNGDDTKTEEDPFTFDFSIPRVDEELLRTIKLLNLKRTEKDVLLLYSGGKDSALAAVRLHNQGYNIHFIHFDNGAMRDADKPYLTFKNSFGLREGYYFDYRLSSYNIAKTFQSFFEKWRNTNGDTLEDGTLTSEIRCLSCRMAMYVEAISYATANGYKYIAEGARISQKFMLEQEAMVTRLKELASHYGIELLFPVLTLDSDEAEKRELLENGFSSKSWESKCLLGRAAADKTKEDEETILTYFDETLKPKMLRLVNHQKEYTNEPWYLNEKSPH